MNIYANSFVMLPYYAGITSHADSGHLQTYHPSLADLMTIPDRLLRFYPWLPRAVPLLLILGFIIAALWLLITLASSRPAIAAKE
jgi:hypothetical protein